MKGPLDALLYPPETAAQELRRKLGDFLDEFMAENGADGAQAIGPTLLAWSALIARQCITRSEWERVAVRAFDLCACPRSEMTEEAQAVLEAFERAIAPAPGGAS